MAMLAHTEKSEGYHLSLAMEQTVALGKQVGSLGQQLEERNTQVAQLTDRCDEFERLFGQMTTKVAAMQRVVESYSELESRVNTMQGLVSEVGSAAASSATNASTRTTLELKQKQDETAEMVARADASMEAWQQKVSLVEAQLSAINRQVSTDRG